MLVELSQAVETAGIWACSAALAVGCGVLLSRPRELSTKSVFLNFWLGLAVWVFVLQAAHLLVPIGPVVGGAIATLGLAGLVLRRAPLARWILGSRPWTKPAAWIAVIVVVWLGNRAAGPPGHVDAQIYHVHAVEWATAYPAVPGLGNLHDRLGFNNCAHLLAALFEGTLFRGGSHHVTNGLLLAACAAYIVACVGAVLRGARRWWMELFYPVLSTPVVGLALSTNISSNTTDPAATLFALGCAWCVLELLMSRRDEPATGAESSVRGDPARSVWFLGAVTLAAAAVCAKLSALPLSFFLVVAATLSFVRGGSVPVREKGRTLVAAAVIAASLGATWSARSVILSGYLLYPTTALNPGVAWAVPLAQARVVQGVVRADARKVRDIRSARLDGFGWFTPWLKGQVRSLNALWVLVPLGVSGTLIVVVILRWRCDETLRAVRLALPVLAAVLAGAAVWFLHAPMPRMGAQVFWSLAGVTAVLAGAGLASGPRRARWMITGLVLAPVAAPCAGAVLLGDGGGSMFDRVRGAVFIEAGPAGAWHPAPDVVSAAFVNEHGVELAVPVSTTGLWGKPLMSTPFPSFRLALRDPSDVSRGFITSDEASSPVEPASATLIADYLRREMRPGDRLVMNAAAVEAMRAEFESQPLPEGTQAVRAGSLDELLEAFSSLAGGGRTWTLYAGATTPGHEDQMQSALYALELLGPRQQQFHAAGISVFLHDLNR